jgi:mono/diheme cytochrome c family protein
MFDGSYDAPDLEEFSPSKIASDAVEQDAAWYNVAGIRSLFGDFKPTEAMYVTDAEEAQKLIERGRILTTGAAACGVCHSSQGKTLSGGRWMKDSFGRVQIANITPAQSGIKGWNVFELMRAIRASIDRAGRPLSLDAHQSYRWMSDRDAKAISLYLLSQPAVENKVERRKLGGFERNTWGLIPKHSEVAGYVPAPMEQDSVGFGRYLANHVSGCVQCHTPGGANSGNPLFSGFYKSESLTGLLTELTSLFDSTPLEEEVASELVLGSQSRKSAISAGELKTLYDQAINEGNFPIGGPNIRGNSGLKQWSEEDIVRYLSSGLTPEGEVREKRFCPWDSYALMNEQWKRAIARYLKTI